MAYCETWSSPLAGVISSRGRSVLVVLCGLILFVTWVSIGRLGPTTAGNAMGIGTMWLALTLIFEFVVGHFLFHKPRPTLLTDYDLRRGRIWVAVLLDVPGSALGVSGP